MTRPKAPEAREKILKLLAQHPEGMRNHELAIAIYGDSKNELIRKRHNTSVSFVIRALAEAQRVYKDGGLFGAWKLSNGATRPQVQVHDLPDATPGRGRPRGSKNGHANGAAPASLRAYIIRDIRAKLAELEALE